MTQQPKQPPNKWEQPSVDKLVSLATRLRQLALIERQRNLEVLEKLKDVLEKKQAFNSDTRSRR
jgi:hypothetical protein